MTPGRGEGLEGPAAGAPQETPSEGLEWPVPSGAWGKALAGGLLLLWLSTVLLLSHRHEPWRDEVRALTLATEPVHGWELPSVLRNEGHPVLWYALLRAAHRVFGTPVVLQGVSVAVAFLAVALLFGAAPFPLWWKALFAFSFLPLYEYSVLARNYGLTMALAFAFAAAYPQRGRRPYLLALILALLANSNLHSLPLAGGFLALWLWEDGLSGGWKGAGRRLGRLALPAMAVVAAGAFALWTCLPERGNLPPGASAPSPAGLLGTLGAAALHPGETFPVLLPLPGWMRDLALWGLLAGFAGWIPGLLLLLGYDLALQVLFRTVYPGGLRQQGLLLVAFVAVAWMSRGREERPQAGEDRGRRLPRALFRLALFGLLPLLFGLHLYLSKGPLRQDWRRPFTSAPALAALLEREPGLGGAILVPEPDWLLESLPYYSAAPVYLPRQGAFARRVSYRRGVRKELTLGELLGAAEVLKARHGLPVLVVWGHAPVVAGQAGEAGRAGEKSLRWTAAEADAFLASVKLVAHFQGAISDENYRVYRLNP